MVVLLTVTLLTTTLLTVTLLTMSCFLGTLTVEATADVGVRCVRPVARVAAEYTGEEKEAEEGF